MRIWLILHMSQTFSFDQVTVHYDQEIGEGSLGTRVYRATWQGKTMIAVKRVPFSCTHHQKQFQREYNFMKRNFWYNSCIFNVFFSKIIHSSILPCYGCATGSNDTNKYFFYAHPIMKQNLYLFLQENRGKLSWDQKWLIVRKIARGIEYLHKKNIIHRDLKGLNVLVRFYSVCKLSCRSMKQVQLSNCAILVLPR